MKRSVLIYLTLVFGIGILHAEGVGTYHVVDCGSSMQIIATSLEHWHFVRWNDGVLTPTRTVTIYDNYDYIAEFAIDQHTLTVESSNSLMGNVTGSGTYDYNSSVSLIASANYGYVFEKWSDGNTDNPRIVIVSGNASYLAKFKPIQYNVLAVSSDDAMGSVIGGGIYNYNEEITMSAVPESGYQFLMWDDSNTDNPRIIIVSGDASYIAYFEEKQGDIVTNLSAEKVSNGALKMIDSNHQLIIIRNGRKYSAAGRLIK